MRQWCRLSAFGPFRHGQHAAPAVNHQNLFVRGRRSAFNLAPDVPRSARATAAIDDQDAPTRCAGIDPWQLSGHRRGFFFQPKSLDNEGRFSSPLRCSPVYIVLGVLLYESYVQPDDESCRDPPPPPGSGRCLGADSRPIPSFSQSLALIGVILLIGDRQGRMRS